jgi:hypothetical protein
MIVLGSINPTASLGKIKSGEKRPVSFSVSVNPLLLPSLVSIRLRQQVAHCKHSKAFASFIVSLFLHVMPGLGSFKFCYDLASF